MYPQARVTVDPLQHVPGGFGYGIEDADEDDDDIYRSGPSSSIADGPGRFAFNQDEDEDDEMLRMGPSRSKAGLSKVRLRWWPCCFSSCTLTPYAALAEQNDSRPSRPSRPEPPISSSTWHDGRPVIRGFIVSSKPIMDDKWFEPPEVPAGWEPRPSRVWNRGKKWDMTPADEKSAKDKGKGKENEVVDGNEAWKRRQAITADQASSLSSPSRLVD